MYETDEDAGTTTFDSRTFEVNAPDNDGDDERQGNCDDD